MIVLRELGLEAAIRAVGPTPCNVSAGRTSSESDQMNRIKLNLRSADNASARMSAARSNAVPLDVGPFPISLTAPGGFRKATNAGDSTG